MKKPYIGNRRPPPRRTPDPRKYRSLASYSPWKVARREPEQFKFQLPHAPAITKADMRRLGQRLKARVRRLRSGHEEYWLKAFHASLEKKFCADCVDGKASLPEICRHMVALQKIFRADHNLYDCTPDIFTEWLTSRKWNYAEHHGILAKALFGLRNLPKNLRDLCWATEMKIALLSKLGNLAKEAKGAGLQSFGWTVTNIYENPAYQEIACEAGMDNKEIDWWLAAMKFLEGP